MPQLDSLDLEGCNCKRGPDDPTRVSSIDKALEVIPIIGSPRLTRLSLDYQDGNDEDSRFRWLTHATSYEDRFPGQQRLERQLTSSTSISQSVEMRHKPKEHMQLLVDWLRLFPALQDVSIWLYGGFEDWLGQSYTERSTAARLYFEDLLRTSLPHIPHMKVN